MLSSLSTANSANLQTTRSRVTKTQMVLGKTNNNLAVIPQWRVSLNSVLENSIPRTPTCIISYQYPTTGIDNCCYYYYVLLLLLLLLHNKKSRNEKSNCNSTILSAMQCLLTLSSQVPQLTWFTRGSGNLTIYHPAIFVCRDIVHMLRCHKNSSIEPQTIGPNSPPKKQFSPICLEPPLQ